MARSQEYEVRELKRKLDQNLTLLTRHRGDLATEERRVAEAKKKNKVEDSQEEEDAKRHDDVVGELKDRIEGAQSDRTRKLTKLERDLELLQREVVEMRRRDEDEKRQEQRDIEKRETEASDFKATAKKSKERREYDLKNLEGFADKTKKEVAQEETALGQQKQELERMQIDLAKMLKDAKDEHGKSW